MNITAVIIDSARQIDQLFSCAEMSAEHTSGRQTGLLRLGAFGVDTTAIADSRVDCWSIAVWRINLLRFTKMTGASGETADQQRFTITATTITWHYRSPLRRTSDSGIGPSSKCAKIVEIRLILPDIDNLDISYLLRTI